VQLEFQHKDVIFTAGALSLAWFVAGRWFGWSVEEEK